MITITNKRRGETGEYIGRGSPLGNPFIIGKDGTREEVVEKYRKYFYKNKYNEKIGPEISRLSTLWHKNGHLELLCFCAPEPCHGNIIKEYLEEVNRTIGESLKVVIPKTTGCISNEN